jgi:hypothetical protein
VDTFLQKFGTKIKGGLTGFDRMVFKGMFRPLMFAAGAQAFLAARGVLNKLYKEWMLEQSTALVASANNFAQTTCGQGIIPIPSCHERKEEIAHARQQERGVSSGLIGVWSCVEACTTYRAHYDATAGFPQLRMHSSRCKHLYFYYDHADYGFMSIRLQTWFPFGIQIAVNGREWLRRALDQAGCRYLIAGNKFLHIDDYELAQRLLNQQIDTRWVHLLTDNLPQVFPTMTQTLGDSLSYYWTLWQSEWATDYIFASPTEVTAIMERLLRHALMTGTGGRVLRYMGRPVRANEQPHALANPDVLTRVNTWYDGARIRHWVDHNSVKLYNEQNVLRTEMTMNAPAAFRVFRHAEGQQDTPKQRLPLRKGLADIAIRTQVADDINQRFMAQMATLKDETPMRDLLQDIVRPSTQQGRRVRGLEITGKDRALLQAIADPQHGVSGITNKQLQHTLGSNVWANGHTGKALSARISRHLRLLRDHGIIRKLPNQRKYQLTEKGRRITTALNVLLAASTEQLLEKAA